MKRFLMLMVCSWPLLLRAQEVQQAEYQSFLKAKAVLDKAIQSAGIQADTLNMAVLATGMVHQSGHYPAPGERLDMPESYTLRFFQGAANYFLKAETTQRGNPYVRQVYARGDSLFYKSFFGRSVSRRTNEVRIDLFDEILTLHPILLLKSIQRSRQSLLSLRYVGRAQKINKLSVVLNGTLFTLQMAENGDLLEASYLSSSDYYGDYIQRYVYGNYQSVGTYQLPKTVREYEYGALRKEQTYTYDLTTSTGLPTNLVCPGCALLPRSNADVGTETKKIGDNLYLVNLNQYDNRSLVLVGDKSVTVFEAPLHEKAARAILRAVQIIAPGKSVGQVLITHHHPDHAGGLRPFAEQGAVIITTKGNPTFLTRLVNFPHKVQGDLRHKILKPAFIVVDSSRVFNAGTTTEFSVYFTGETKHTNEYLLAYFPIQKLLFHGDLCFFSTNGEVYPANDRDLAVAKVIDHYKLDVKKVCGSWPIRNYKEMGTKSEFDQKLQAVKK